ncbi:histidine phosphatase family protein [Desulfovibrio oxyclinae]|uniref:histidine phosphatase family protein n=1 Tax=Desulfovibrio oxyclinae TaxID=63560 RepID=UPI00037BF8ED|nr:histidine phosphatase family protein [Desulfovibrio oxyclinae]
MIVLMRHAGTEGGAGRCIGRAPLALSSAGRKEANQLGDELCDLGFVRLCTSPSQRAMVTLLPLAEKLGLETEAFPALDEIDMGIWDGLSFDAIRKRHPEAYAQRGRALGTFRVPGGESFVDVAERAYSCLVKLFPGPQHVLAVTHAGVIRSLLCRLTGHPLNALFDFKPEHLGCTILTHKDGCPNLVATDLTPAMVKSYL